MDVTQKKAAAYDMIAQVGYYQNLIQQIQQKLQELNQQIAEDEKKITKKED